MRAAGFEPEDYETDEVEVWPENHASFSIFESMRTQWRSSMNGYYGLDYGVLHRELDDLGLAGEERQKMKADIRLMERAALRELQVK